MAELICDTSVLQYLHQLELLHVLDALSDQVIIPQAVVDELAAGRALGFNVPDPSQLAWATIRQPASAVVLPLVSGLGPGETEVLALGLEHPHTTVVLDDQLGRRTAEGLGLSLTGTLGILIDAKRSGLAPTVAPLLDRLHTLGFRLSERMREVVLDRAGEASET